MRIAGVGRTDNNIYPPVQFWAGLKSVGPALSQQWTAGDRSERERRYFVVFSSKHVIRWPNVDLILAQRLRCWANIEATLGQGITCLSSRGPLLYLERKSEYYVTGIIAGLYILQTDTGGGGGGGVIVHIWIFSRVSHFAKIGILRSYCREWDIRALQLHEKIEMWEGKEKTGILRSYYEEWDKTIGITRKHRNVKRQNMASQNYAFCWFLSHFLIDCHAQFLVLSEMTFNSPKSSAPWA